MKIPLKALAWFLMFVVTVAGSVGSITATPFATARHNGASWFVAFEAGAASILHPFIIALTSIWVWLPITMTSVAVLAFRLGGRKNRTKHYSTRSLGSKMHLFIAALNDDRKWSGLSYYTGTTELLGEIDAFLFVLRKPEIKTPSPQSKDCGSWLELCYRYFSVVGPFLRDGDAVSAKIVAEQIADQNPRHN